MYVYSNTLFAVFYITNLTYYREIDENVAHQILLTSEDLFFCDIYITYMKSSRNKYLI